MGSTDKLQNIDYEELAKHMAPEIAKHLHIGCPMGWNEEDIQTLSDFAASLRKIKSTILGAVVYAIMIFLLGALAMGIKMQIKP